MNIPFSLHAIKHFCFLLSIAICLNGLQAQSLSQDLRHLQEQATIAAELKSNVPASALDTVISILAYYAAAPDMQAAQAMATGPEVMDHYANNTSINQFLIDKGLDSLLWKYIPADTLSLDWLVDEQRMEFLRRPNATELFSRNGLVDVSKIQAAYQETLPPLKTALSTAANNAKLPEGGTPSANYVSLALSGLSDWIGRRAQEELSYTFLSRLRTQLNENGLNYLFPHTTEYLPTLNLINYKSILPSLRLAFAQDLNQISLSLGNFLQAQDRATYNDPAVYNLFLVYRLLDLGAREVPLSDILAFTYGELADSRRNTRVSIDLKLAESAESSKEYSPIVTSYQRCMDALDQLERAFQLAKGDLSDMEEDLVDQFDEAAVRPIRSYIDTALNFDYSDLLFERDEAPEIIGSWLNGKQAYNYYLANPSLSQYDQLFTAKQDTVSVAQLRAAGLTGLREILDRRGNLRKRHEDLIDARRSIDSLRALLSTPGEPKTLVAFKSILGKRISGEMGVVGNTQQDSIRLTFLANLLAETIPSTADAEDRLNAISSRLDAFTNEKAQPASPNYQRLHPPPLAEENYPAIGKLIDQVELEFNQMYTALNTYSQTNAGDLIRAHRNAANFETVFGLGKELFFFLYDPNRAIPSGAGGMKKSGAMFAKTGTMTTFLLDPSGSSLVRGLAMERFEKVPGLGQFSPSGIGQLVVDFTEQLSLLRAPADNMPVERKVAGRIQMVNFITSTVSTLVKAPIFNDPLRPNQTLSLADKFPGFQKVPEINSNLNELFQLSQTGQFRYAVTNLINLIDLFNVIPPASKRQQRMVARRETITTKLEDVNTAGVTQPYAGLALSTTQQISSVEVTELRTELDRINKRLSNLDEARSDRSRQRLFLYGTFMADVAAAETPDAFAAALNNVALPPGSSQLKRSKPFSLEVNAYFGMSLANEVLDLPENTDPGVIYPEAEARSLALYVPVGLSMSWKGSYNQKSSYSLFFPLIDLGAVSAYRFDSNNDQVDRLPSFSFQNVFAPGAHLLYNFANTPFSLGVGAQYGPSLRNIRPDGAPSLNVPAVRYMLTFSVDVPIFSFTNRP